ncbi:dUTP diphosphatase [Candidatus Uhrbacteria bacterium]|nr:dUTP diphosphatase [Candidatus Uhrbacteria bacterium]
MSIKIKRVDNSLPLPRYESEGAVAFDLLAREDALVPGGEIALVPVNVIVQTPPGYMLILASRSSLPLKKGLVVPNGIGIVDQDYCGPDDELKIQILNIKSAPAQISRGERIAQGIFVKMERADWQEVPEMQSKSRGGFGSTGGYAGHLAPHIDS